MKISRIIEAAIRSEPDAVGFAFSVGERFLMTLTFRTAEEAAVARRAIAKLLTDAAEMSGSEPALKTVSGDG